MLTIDDVVKDFDAICDRVDREGRSQPPFVPTVAENLVYLGWHQKEFEVRRSFAYTVVAPDESQVFDCAYLTPSETHGGRVKLGFGGARTRTGSIPSSRTPSGNGCPSAGPSNG